MSPDALTRWSELLARLETDLEHARAGRALAPWQPPADMPPLPAALAARARALRRAQDELYAGTATERAELLRRVAQARRNARPSAARPVYLDAVG